MSFTHKGLEALYRTGSKKGVQATHAPKLQRILTALDIAETPRDLAIPSFRIHPLSGRRAEEWSIMVNGNWRVTFRFTDEGNVVAVNYEDYH